MIADSGTIVVLAGAGMSVDAGLPDFRSENGVWRNTVRFGIGSCGPMAAGSAGMFALHPDIAWEFYRQRAQEYCAAQPHAGYRLLAELQQKKELFVITTNVDGMFAKAGLAEERLLELHGNISWLQCRRPCSDSTWPAPTAPPDATLPDCPHCGSVARPNVLMFGDRAFARERLLEQRQRWELFRSAAQQPVTVLEIGAGTVIPTLRHLGRQIAQQSGGVTLRINSREAQIEKPGIAFAGAAAETMTALCRALERIERK